MQINSPIPPISPIAISLKGSEFSPMSCNKRASNTLSKDQATALYNTIDYQLLKQEAKVSDSDAKILAKGIDKPLNELPSLDSIDILSAINKPEFAKLLLYTFIPEESSILKQNPKANDKRDKQKEYIDLIVKRTNLDRAYVQKHLRNALVNGYGKSPENILHDVISGSDKDLKGLGLLPALIAAAVPLISGAFGPSKLDADHSTVGFDNFINSVDRGKIFPTKDEMLLAAKQGNWETVNIPAINSTYNQVDGTFVRGDWHFAVISLTPISVRQFKGHEESYTLSSPTNSKALEMAYANQIAPNAKDFTTNLSAQTNVTNDPAYKVTPWYKTIPGMFGIGFGVLAVGVSGYALLSSDKK